MTSAAQKLSLSSLLMVATAAFATGCDRGVPKSEAKPTAAILSAGRSVEAPKPEMPKVGAPGWAYINAGGDIVAIDPTGRVQTLKPAGGYSFVQRITRASDGKAYALLSRSRDAEVVWLDGNKLVSVAKMSGCSLSDGAFDARDDHMVASCGDKLQEKPAGGTWTSVATPDSAGATQSLVAVAKGGALWYVRHDGFRTRAVYERKAGTWTALDIKQSEYDTPKAFVESSEGGVVWTSSGRLVRATEGAAAPIYAEKNLSALTPASNGLLGFWNLIVIEVGPDAYAIAEVGPITGTPPDSDSRQSPQDEALTRREGDVLQLIGDGLSNKEIARDLCVSVATVKHHVHNILEKLHVPRRAQAMRRVREAPWIASLPRK